MTLLSTWKTAKKLEMTPDGVRYHARLGRLLSLKIDQGNGRSMRLFLEEDVERFQKQRAERLTDKHEVANVG